MTDHGLEVAHMPELRPFIDIVCVHGYNADTDQTWTHPETGKSWIADVEFVKHIPRQARVMSFSYNGDIAANLSAASVAFHAGDLLSCVEQSLAKSTGGPLFFVAHGLGGIIVKKAIQLLPTILSRYPRIKRAIAGAVYFGTPHTETNSDALFKAVKSFVALSSSSQQCIELQEECRNYASVVSYINTQFNKVKPKNFFQLTYYESKKKTKKDSDVVLQDGGEVPDVPDYVFTRDCSKPDDTCHLQVDVDCSYADLARFASVYDSRFTSFIDRFSGMIDFTFKDRDIRMVNGPPLLPPPLPLSTPPPSPPLQPLPPLPPLPPPPPPPKEDDKLKTQEPQPLVSTLEPVPYPRDRTEEQYQLYVRKRGYDDHRVAWDCFLDSLKGWSDTNRGKGLVVAPGTCEWFKEMKEYQDWVAANSDEIMFFLGDVGQGKTHLARTISDHLRFTKTSDIVIDFFCDPEATDENPAIWDCLTWTLLRERMSLFSNIPWRHRLRTSDSPRLTFDDAIDIWSSFVDIFPPPDIYLIIDGLDQYGHEYLVDFVHCIEKIQAALVGTRSGPVATLRSGAPPHLKVLITHRPQGFPQDVGDRNHPVYIPPYMTKKDIRLFMDWKGPALHPASFRGPTADKAPDPTRKEIEDLADIYWPLVRHAVDDVRFLAPYDCVRAPSFREKMPVGLEQYYRSLLLPMLQCVGNEAMVLRATLQFLSSPQSRPPSVQIISDAISVLFENDNDPGSLRRDITMGLSRHLGKVLFIHKEGAISLHHDSFGTFLERFYTPEQRYATRAYICLKYLLKDCFRDFDVEIMSDTNEAKELLMKVAPFYYHACHNWAGYVSKLDAFEPRLQELLCQFLRPGCPQFQTYHRYMQQSEVGVSLPESPTPEGAVLYPLLFEGAAGFFRHFFPFPSGHGGSKRAPTWISRAQDALRHAWRPDALLNNIGETTELGIPGWPNMAMDAFGGTPLMVAAASGRLDLVRHILQWPVNINARGSERCSALFDPLSGKESTAWFVAQSYDPIERQEMMVSIMDELLRHGADPNLCEETGYTPLSRACARGDLTAVRLLLDAGADVDAGDVDGINPLSEAIRVGSEEVVRELLFSRVFVDTWLPRGETPLMQCIRTDQLSIFKMLLPIADVNMAYEGRGAIHFAVSHNRLDFLRLLLTRPDLDLDLMGDDTALGLAVSTGNFEAAKMLLQAGAYAGFMPPKMEMSPLASAVGRRDIAMAELLLEYQAPVNEYAFDFDEKTALAVAVAEDDAVLVELLLAYGADPSVEDGFGVMGPLHIAIFRKDPNKEIVRLLFAATIPPDINYSPPGQDHVLLPAILENDVELVKLMLRHGVDTSLWLEMGPFLESDRCRGGPLHVAADKGFLEICELLVEHDPRLLNMQVEHRHLYDSPLHTACLSNQKEIVRFFLNKGANPEQLSYFFGESPLLVAAGSNDVKLVEMVLKAAPQMLNVESFLADTPIREACKQGNLEVVRLLLEAGADIHARDRFGDTCAACIFDSRGGKSPCKLLDLLLQHGQGINDFVTDTGCTLLAEAIFRGNVHHVRGVLDRGADPMRCYIFPGCPGPWVNALQTAFHVGVDEVIELLLEPRWGLWPHVTQQDCYGTSALMIPRYGRYQKPGRLRLLLQKSEENMKLTGHDAFAEMMLQTSITGWSVVDYARNATGVSPSGRARFNQVVGEALASLANVVRTMRDHHDIMFQLGVLLLLVPEYREGAQTLLSATSWVRDVSLEKGGIARTVRTQWPCKLCKQLIRETCYMCAECRSACCGECVEKPDWNTRPGHDHDWIIVPFEGERDLNSKRVQEAIDMLVAELLKPSSEATAEVSDTQHQQLMVCETLQERQLQAGLQLATLHAFNRLAVRRPAWAPYLGLSGAAEELIAPFTHLIHEQRWHVERCNLAYEDSVARRLEESQYFSRGLCQRYADEDLVQRETTMEHIRELFVIEESKEKDLDSAGRPREGPSRRLFRKASDISEPR